MGRIINSLNQNQPQTGGISPTGVTGGGRIMRSLAGQQPVEQKQTLGGFFGEALTRGAQEARRPTSFLGGLGAELARPILGLGQAIARPIQQQQLVGMQKDIQESRKQLSDTADQYIAMAQGEQDPARKSKLLGLARSTIQESERLGKPAEEIRAITPESVSIGKDIERITGQAVGAAATLAPFTRALRGPMAFARPVQTGLQRLGMQPQKALKAVSAARGLLPRTIESAALGGAFGAGAALAEERPVGEVIGAGLGGAAFGAAIPPAFVGLGAGVRVVGAARRAVAPRGREAVQQLENVWTNIFRGTKTGAKKFEAGIARQRNAAKFLAEKGEFIDLKENKYNPIALIGRLRSSIADLENQVISPRLEGVKRKFSLNQFEKSVLAAVDNAVTKAEGTVAQKQNEVRRLFQAFRDSYGNMIDANTVQQIKIQQGNLSKVFDAAKPKFAQDVNYQISKLARQMIEKTLKGVKGVNKVIADHENAIKLLRTIEGNAVKGGRLGKYVGGTVGAFIGSQAGGFLGTIGGYVLGDRVAGILGQLSTGSPFLRRAIERLPKSQPEEIVKFLEIIKRKSPSAYRDLLQELSSSQIIQPIAQAAMKSKSPILQSITQLGTAVKALPGVRTAYEIATGKEAPKEMPKIPFGLSIEEVGGKKLPIERINELYKLDKKLQLRKSRLESLSRELTTKEERKLSNIYKQQERIDDTIERIQRFSIIKETEEVGKKKLPITYKGEKDITTKFLDYAKGKTILSRQEIVDFARRPELKKGEANLLNRVTETFTEPKIPAQKVANFIDDNILRLKPLKVKDTQYQHTSIDGIRKSQGKKEYGKNYEEVIFESPITTNGSSHYPNSKNYFAHARGDEVVESGKKIWREQEIQSDLLQKEGLARVEARSEIEIGDMISVRVGSQIKEGRVRDIIGNRIDFELPTGQRLDKTFDEIIFVERTATDISQLQPFTNDRFGERIMRERIKEKASKGYSKYRLPTGETIGKIEGFQARQWVRSLKGDFDEVQKLTPENMKIGDLVGWGAGGEDWIITDILGDGRFKAVPKEIAEESKRFIEGSKGQLDFLESRKEIHDLTGKSNPQYRRYQDWGKFLKNKFGGKEVTDLQGNSWMEIDLKKEYKRMPIEAFGFAALIPKTVQRKEKNETQKREGQVEALKRAIK